MDEGTSRVPVVDDWHRFEVTKEAAEQFAILRIRLQDAFSRKVNLVLPLFILMWFEPV